MGGFVHLELNTDNVKKAKAFYSKLFGWETTDLDMGSGPYTMLQLQNPGGGMAKKQQADAPSMWVPYIAVDDVRKTVQAAEKAGATMVGPYFEAEGMGEGAVLMDPSGAAFGIWKSLRPAGASNGETNGEVDMDEDDDQDEDQIEDQVNADEEEEEEAPKASRKTGKKTASKKTASKKTASKKTASKKTASKKAPVTGKNAPVTSKKTASKKTASKKAPVSSRKSPPAAKKKSKKKKR